ncbi:deoxyribodipyrimidine photo-lyase [Kribbella sp. VKM Ac-2569]|uniref:deoxyribodipyrimidine photo-lyase n=1 Tax=Kribbella sp. VKM Ac-2569 TaxID=2512220 RepID=UPI001F544C92
MSTVTAVMWFRRDPRLSDNPAIADEVGAVSVHVSADYAPYGQQRDEEVEASLKCPLVRTGFVGAGMRQLAATGFMHNRVRMVVASFLVKDLHVHWRFGARWFMRSLRDLDGRTAHEPWSEAFRRYDAIRS